MSMRALLSDLRAALDNLAAVVVNVSAVASEARRTGIHAQRAAMGAHAFYSLPQAIRMLPMPAEQAEAFLVERGLVRRVDGVALVHWGSVEAAINGRDPESVPLPPEMAQSVRAKPLPRRVRLG